MKVNSNININSDELSKSIELFQKDIKTVSDKLNNLSNLMKELGINNDTWNSKTSKAVYEEFANIETNFEKINAELSAYDIFLQKTLEEYKNEEMKEEKSIEESSENLDIN